MSKRVAVDSIEDWALVVDQVITRMHLYTLPLSDRITMGRRTLIKLEAQRLLSPPEFVIIWETRIQRVRNMIRVLKEVLDMEVVEVLL